MKLFQAIQNYFAIVGINSPQQKQKFPDNKKALIILMLLIINYLFVCVFLFRKAKNFEEIANTFYNAVTIIVIIIDHVIHIWKSDALFKFIEIFEKFIQKSEYKQLSVIE